MRALLLGLALLVGSVALLALSGYIIAPAPGFGYYAPH
jgi:hypothetical protein